MSKNTFKPRLETLEDKTMPAIMTIGQASIDVPDNLTRPDATVESELVASHLAYHQVLVGNPPSEGAPLTAAEAKQEFTADLRVWDDSWIGYGIAVDTIAAASAQDFKALLEAFPETSESPDAAVMNAVTQAEAAATQLGAARDAVFELQESKDAKTASAEHAVNALSASRMQLDGLSHALGEAQSTLSTLESQAAAGRAPLDAQRAVLRDLQAQHAVLEAAYQEAQQALAGHLAAQAVLSQDHDQKVIAVNAAQQQLANAKNANGLAYTKAQQLTAAATQAKTSYDTAKANEQTLLTAKNTAQANLDQANLTLAAAQTKYNAALAQYTKKPNSANMKTLQAALTALNDAKVKQKAASDAYTLANQNYQAAVLKSQTALTTYQQAVINRDKAIADAAAAQKALADAQPALDAALAALANVQQALEASKAKADSLKTEADARAAKVAESSGKLVPVQDAVLALEAEQREHEEAVLAQLDLVRDLETQIAATQEEVDSLEALAEGLTAEITSLTSAIAVAEQEAADAMQAYEQSLIALANALAATNTMDPEAYQALVREEAALLVKDLIHSGLSSTDAYAIACGKRDSMSGSDETARGLWAEAALILEEDYVNKRDALDLTGTPSATPYRVTLEIPLEHLGGTARLESLRGLLTADPRLTHLTTDQVSRLLGAIDTTLPASPVFRDVVGIAEGQFSNTWNRTIDVPGVGAVTIVTDTGQRNWNYAQVAPFQYIGVHNGALVSTQTTDVNNIRRHYKPGEAGITLELGSGTYVSAITVQRISATGAAYLTVVGADGTTRNLPVDGNGTVRIDDTVRTIHLQPSGGSAYGIVSLDARPVVPLALPSDMGDARQILGAGGVLDFSGAEKIVTAASGRLLAQNPADVVTIAVYQGEKKVQEIQVTDGTFSVSQAGGISSIIIKHSSPSSPLVLADVVTETDGSLTSGIWKPVSTQTNGDISRIDTKQWETGASYNWIDVAKRNNVFFRYGGQEVTIYGSLRESINYDPAQYNRLDVRTRGSGSVEIRGFYYVNANGLHELPSDRYVIVSPNTAIIFPGGPQHIVVQMAGNGPLDTPHTSAQGASAAEVAPSVAPVLSAGWIVYKEQPGTEGWADIPSGVSDAKVVMVAGSTFGSLWEIKNDGLTGAEVTVKVYVGQTGTAADQLQKTYTGTIGGMQRRGLATNITLNKTGDRVTIIVERKDGGPTVVQSRAVTAPVSSETRVLDEKTGQLVWVSNHEMPDPATLQRVARLYAKISDYKNDPAMRIAAENLAAASTAQEQEAAYTALTGLPAHDSSLATLLASNAEVESKIKIELIAYNGTYGPDPKQGLEILRTGKFTYTVASGEVLSSIAARFKVTVSAILSMPENAYLSDAKHNNGNSIWPGEKIVIPLAGFVAQRSDIETKMAPTTLIGRDKAIAAKTSIENLANELTKLSGQGSIVLNLSSHVNVSDFTELSTAPRGLILQSLDILASIPSELNRDLGYIDGQLQSLETALAAAAKVHGQAVFDSNLSAADRASSFVAFSLLTSLETLTNVAKNLTPSSTGEAILMAATAQLGPVVAKAWGVISARGIPAMNSIIGKLTLAYRNSGLQGMHAVLDGEVDRIATPAVKEATEVFYRNESIHVYRPLIRLTVTEGDEIAIRHILSGEIKKGVAKGGHVLSAVQSGQIKLIEGTVEVSSKGITRAKIEVRNSVTGQYIEKVPTSTFFPASWTEDEVVAAIKEAASNAIVDGDGVWVGMSRGLRIQINKSSSYIQSAYPLFE